MSERMNESMKYYMNGSINIGVQVPYIHIESMSSQVEKFIVMYILRC